VPVGPPVATKAHLLTGEFDMTIENEYSEFVRSRKKDPAAIEASARNLDLIHMAMGISGEAGELLDAIKKHVIYGKALDVGHVIEELGDLEFYMEGLRQTLKLSRDRIIADNITKLGKRYPSGYSDHHASERNDKK
jgi:NTP pyrophosphatase (non-canonical NTP hydrolase)